MSTKKKAVKKTIKASENTLKAVTEQLNTSLTSLKVELGEKKFKKRIKKVAKKLVAGIKIPPAKKAVIKAVKIKSTNKKTINPKPGK
ncbi:hypothetical protein [Ferruginibacter sp.]